MPLGTAVIKQNRWLMRVGFAGSFLLLIQCLPSRILYSPIPSEIISVEGYASLRVYGEQGMGRTKFSFIFLLPDKGNLEASNFLGQTIYRITVNPEGAYLIIPSKKVYWKGQEEEIIYMLLGFKLTMREMISLLTGEWQELGSVQAEELDQRWELEKDQLGRIISGRRGPLNFKIEEFADDSHLARRLVFDNGSTAGRVRLIKAAFNKPIKSGTFSTAILINYQQKSWEEIQALIDNED
ncbi:MAG: hypothetical protein JW755_04055 [Candidatus Aminicenantes bacterium]|nr:hypothetical protein [Candidatus Aminicenantes bacterium]